MSITGSDGSDLIFIVTAGFSFLFILLRVLMISDCFKLMFSEEVVQSGYQFAQSWASNLTVFTALLGVALPLISGDYTSDLQALNFFYAITFAESSLIYIISTRIIWFVVADFIMIWSVLGSTSSLWWAIYVVDYFPSTAKWYILVSLPICLLLIVYYTWFGLKTLIEQIKTEMQTKSLHRDFEIHTKWSFR
jgi:hypothetical protein